MANSPSWSLSTNPNPPSYEYRLLVYLNLPDPLSQRSTRELQSEHHR